MPWPVIASAALAGPLPGAAIGGSLLGPASAPSLAAWPLLALSAATWLLHALSAATWPLLLSAALSGLAVVAITWIAGRVGGALGGLLATAPVTTTAALLYLGLDGQADVLHGAKSLSAALLAMPAFFAAVLWTRRLTDRLRVAAGLLVFVALFTGLGLLAGAVTPPGLQVMWVFVTLLLATVLGTTFLHWPVAAGAPSERAMTTTWHEAVMRFAAGAGVILLVDAMRSVHPSLGAAWAVFPGTFLVTLWVLGASQGAAASARASQGGILGIPPLLAYLLTVHSLQGMVAHPAWAWFVQAPAWLAYFATLALMWHAMHPPARAAQPQGSV